MKLFTTFKKLPLITLLSLGLAGLPLVASANDGDRGRHGHYQQDHGKSHHRNDRRRDHRDHGDRHSYRKGYKHGYRNARHHNKRHGHHGRHHNSHQRYGHGHYYDHVGFMLGLYSDNLDVIFRD